MLQEYADEQYNLELKLTGHERSTCRSRADVDRAWVKYLGGLREKGYIKTSMTKETESMKRFVACKKPISQTAFAC